MTKQSVMRVVIAAVACALLLVACGGSSHKPTSANVPVPPPTGTTPPPTHTSTITVSTGTVTTPTVPGARAACVTADFELHFLGQAGATGHGELGFALHNITSQQCHTYGYPGILFLDQSGRPLPTKPDRTTSDFFGTTSENELIVQPGGTVSFRLGVLHGAGNASGCTTAYGLQVIAPDDTHTTTAKIPGGALECGGTATVSPLQADVTAFTT